MKVRRYTVTVYVSVPIEGGEVWENPRQLERRILALFPKSDDVDCEVMESEDIGEEDPTDET